MFDPDHVDVELPELARLGVDPLADGLDADARCGRCSPAGARRLKPLLLDQHVIAGIGNIYADEILHARPPAPRPRRPARCAGRRSRRLHDAMHDVLLAAVGAGGSTLGDNQYVDLMGDGGSYQDDHRVYGRAGERCSTCGRGIDPAHRPAGRSTHFCPCCQRCPCVRRTTARTIPDPGRPERPVASPAPCS